MVVDPLPTSVASPFVPEVLLIVATPGLDDDHVTALVTSSPLAIAVNCRVPLPSVTFGFCGETVMACPVPHTVTLAVPVTPLLAAVIVVVPGATVVSMPVVPSIVATLVEDEDHAAAMFDLLPSLNTPIATICSWVPKFTLGVVIPLLSVTVIEFRVGSTQKLEQPDSHNSPTTKAPHHLIELRRVMLGMINLGSM